MRVAWMGKCSRDINVIYDGLLDMRREINTKRAR